MTHAIRLRGHWTVTPAGPGLMTWVRRFGRPSGLAECTITLRVVAAVFPCRVSVNNGVMTVISASDEHVGLDALKTRNVVSVEASADIVPEIILEIRPRSDGSSN